MDNTVKVGILGAGATIIAAIIGLFAGRSVEQKVTKEYIAAILDNNINIVGNENNIVINDVTSLTEAFIKLQSNYDQLQTENSNLVEQNSILTNDINKVNQAVKYNQSQSNQEIEDLKFQLSNMPIVDYKNLGLSIGTNDIKIDYNKSSVTIDGRDYFSREIVEKVIPEDKCIKIDNNKIFIEDIKAENENLFNKYVIDSDHFENYTDAQDTYGNSYANIIKGFAPRNAYIIYNVNREYSYFKCKIAPEEGLYFSNDTTTVTVLADDIVVYTSEEISNLTEAFETDEIFIDNCIRLKIQLNGGNGRIIISDAVVYN